MPPLPQTAGQVPNQKRKMMTTSSEQSSERDAMSLMARQVAEGSKTLGLHIKQHDDISEAARMWARDVITESRKQLEESHKQVVEETVKSFNATTELLRQDAERLTAQLGEQGARDAASLRETASKLAETSEGTDAAAGGRRQDRRKCDKPRSGTPAGGTHIVPRKGGGGSPRAT